MTKIKLREIDIRPSDRVVFIHIPKTAGTTFKSILETLLVGYSRYPGYAISDCLGSNLDELRQYQVFAGHFLYSFFSEILFPDGFIGLTFLRDPVSRTVSYFNFIKQQFERGTLQEDVFGIWVEEEERRSLVELGMAIFKDIMPLSVPFGQMTADHELCKLRNLLDGGRINLAGNVIDFQTRIMGTSFFHGKGVAQRLAGFCSGLLFRFGKRSTEVMFTNLRNAQAARVEWKNVTPLNLKLAKKRLSRLPFLGIKERYQDSLFLFSYTFGWRPILDQLHLNVTPGSGNKKGLDSKTLALVQEKNSLDIELYQYGLRVFEERFNMMTHTLLRRYGKKEHAFLRWPLPVEVMVELLERHYQNRRDRRCIAQNITAYRYTPSVHSEGLFGWHTIEVSPSHGPYHWSGPGLQSGFDLPCPAGEKIRVSFGILGALRPDIIEKLSVTANGFPVVLTYVHDPRGVLIFSGDIPPGAISGPFISLVFSVPETMTPCSVDPNSPDVRQLGIALNWLELNATDYSS